MITQVTDGGLVVDEVFDDPALDDSSPLLVASATFDLARRYRYELYRWIGDGPTVTFVMLNPSTADAFAFDPTVRRCMGFASRQGAGALYVVNLFAYRSTDPGELRQVDDPTGPHNEVAQQVAIDKAAFVIAAWGSHSKWTTARGMHLRAAYPDVDWRCLGVNADGAPKHPLYVAGDTLLQRWEP